MPRVELYPGDRIRTQPQAKERQTVVPTADVFGAQIGEAQQRVWSQVGHAANQSLQVVDQVLAEQRKRATELVQVTAERQFNQLYQINGLGTERGAQGTRGLLTMQGLEAHEKFDKNLEEWDAQASQIVQAGKTPEQRLMLEAMRDQQRARYVEQGMRHASAELGKHETGEVTALIVSNRNLAISVADTPGGAEVIAETLLRNDTIIDTQGHKIGLTGPEQKAEAKAKIRSETHVGVIKTLIAGNKQLAAEQYFADVTAKTTQYPAGQIDAGVAAELRKTLTVNTRDAKAMAASVDIQTRLGPAAGDHTTPVPTADMQAEARKAATDAHGVFDGDLYARINAYNKDYEGAVTSQRQNVQGATEGALYLNFEEGMSLPALQNTKAWKNADPGLQGKVLKLYDEQRRRVEADRRQAEADARARAGERRAAQDDWLRDYNLDQARRGIEADAAYWTFSPEKLSAFATREALRVAMLDARLNDNQRAHLYNQYDQIKASVAGAAGASADSVMFKEEARRAGETYVYNSSLNTTQEARLGSLRAAVDTAIAQEEQAASEKAGHRVRLPPERQRQVMRDVLNQKVILEHPWYLGGGTTEASLALVVDADDQAIARVPIAKIPPPHLADAINHLVSLRPYLGRMDPAVLQRQYARQLERAYAAFRLGLGDEEIQKRLMEPGTQ